MGMQERERKNATAADKDPGAVKHYDKFVNGWLCQFVAGYEEENLIRSAACKIKQCTRRNVIHTLDRKGGELGRLGGTSAH